MEKKVPYPSIRLFKNDFLERLSHVHPIMPLLIWAPCIVALLWFSFFKLQLGIEGLGLFLFGLLVWTLTEYGLHRFVFHMPGDTKIRETIRFYTHGMHHADPNDPTRLVFPIAPALLVGALVFSLLRGLMGPEWSLPTFAGFGTGYLIYDYIHFATHHFRMSSAVGKFLKEYHMKHHFVDHDTKLGVSSPLWDYIFSTQGKPLGKKK